MFRIHGILTNSCLLQLLDSKNEIKREVYYEGDNEN